MVIAVGLLAAVPPAGARVPLSFFGVTPQGPLLPRDFARMQGTVGSVRISAVWPQLEPQRGQWDFSSLDRLVGQSARRGVHVLLELYGTPAWIRPSAALPPVSRADRAAWLGFVRRLVRRYGPHGTFWDGHAQRLPVHRWQVWNEPNFILFWPPRPEPGRYAKLLGATAHAIHGVDGNAVVVAAGLAPVEGGMSPPAFLRQMYQTPGVRSSFDVAALHPYASTAFGVEYEIRQIREVMAAAGDARTPLQITEIGVASAARSPTPFAKGLRGQARYVTRTLGMLVGLRRRWRIAGVDWFSWQDGALDPHCAFCEFAGLTRLDGAPKPAWRALQRVVRQSQLEP
jgi:hypothetical protein